MSSRWWSAALGTAALGLTYAQPVQAELVSRCLPENDAGTGLSLAVDARGVAHLSRLFRVAGDLVYTVVDPLGEPLTTPVAAFVSQLALDEVDQTDLLLVDGTPYICFYNARRDTFEVAHLDGGAWVREQVAEGARVGDACALFTEGGAVGVLFRDDGTVSRGMRRGPDDWLVDVIDDGGVDPGHGLSIGWVGGRMVVAHRDDGLGDLRVTWQQPGGGWRTDTAEQPNPAGLSPRVADDGAGGVFVLHGVQNADAGDGGLMLTTGVQGDLMTVAFELDPIGGSSDMVETADGRLTLVTRERQRNAIFGAYDGLRIYRDLRENSDYAYIEDWGSAQQRHDYRHIGLALDPFGNPVTAMLVEASPQGLDPGSGLVCIYREVDRDADGLPDVTEDRYGSDPDVADTDGDGVPDGEEVLAGLDPAGPGALPDPEPDPEPDAALPLPDAAVPDAETPPPDGGVPDSSGPISPDMGQPMEPDAAPDAAPPADAGPQGDAEPRGDAAAEPDGGPTLDLGPAGDAAPDPEPEPDTGGEAQDASPTGADGSSGGTGGSDGCRASPGRGEHGWIGLLLLLLGVRRRR